MDNKQKEKYISLVNDLYFRFKSNDELEQRLNNDSVYNKFIESIKILYDNRNYEELSSLSHNIDSIINILTQLDNLTTDASKVSAHNVKVIQYANQLISACDELFKINSDHKNEIKNDSQIDFSHMPEGRIKKLEEERLKTNGEVKDLEDKLKERENDFNQLKTILDKAATLEEDFNNTKDAVLNDYKVQKSYKFWESQATKYQSNYKIYFGINILIAVILFISTFILINYSGLFIQNSPESNSSSTVTIDSLKTLVHSVPFFNYVIFILYTTILIWIMKILVKIMLSNYHLSVDANERVIMIRTYLALIKEGKGFEENDKKVILDNIFRQTNHGIIKDETSVTVADIVSSFKR